MWDFKRGGIKAKEVEGNVSLRGEKHWGLHKKIKQTWHLALCRFEY